MLVRNRNPTLENDYYSENVLFCIQNWCKRRANAGAAIYELL